MKIGERIRCIREKQALSQDAFADRMHVTRQTVSNWENGRSCPDAEMLLRISEEFQISLDELLKEQKPASEECKVEKKPSGRRGVIRLVLVLVVLAAIAAGLAFHVGNQKTMSVLFSMEQDKTYKRPETENSVLDVAEGEFLLPKDGKVRILAAGETDDGILHIRIVDGDDDVRYQLDGQTLEDSQEIVLNQGSYYIQITADGYSEQVVSLHYDVSVSNK